MFTALFTRISPALLAAFLCLGSASALAQNCYADSDCTCGQVCDSNGFSCVNANTGNNGKCDPANGNANCIYQNQTCASPGDFCTPAWSASSVCTQMSTSSTSGSSSTTATAGTAVGSSGTSSDVGSGTGGSGGSVGSGTGGNVGTGTGGTGGTVNCNDDVDCSCGQVCSWAAGDSQPHVCVDASGGDPGWCSPSNTVNGSSCLYQGQTCTGHTCGPAYSSSSVCLASSGSSTTANSGTGSTAVTGTATAGNTVAGTDSGTSANGGTSAGNNGSSGTAGSNTGGTATAGSGTGGTPTACTDDIDCSCGQVCSWAAGVAAPHVCVAASSGDPGWCTPGSEAHGSACLYVGQACMGVSCLPAYSATDTCVSGTTTTAGNGSGSGSGASGSSSSGSGSSGTATTSATTGGTTASADAGSGSGSKGGCSSASGDFTGLVALLGLGLLVQGRRRRA